MSVEDAEFNEYNNNFIFFRATKDPLQAAYWLQKAKERAKELGIDGDLDTVKQKDAPAEEDILEQIAKLKTKAAEMTEMGFPDMAAELMTEAAKLENK